jgi:ribokinase
MPRLGETLEARRFHSGFGGKGANQAVALARLGADVILVARVGDDMFGAEMNRNFEENGIDARFVETVPGLSTGVATISVDDEGNNSILIVKGANGALSPDDVDQAGDAIRQCDMLLLQLEIPLETVYAAIEFGSKNGIPVFLNPAPGMRLNQELVRKVDFLAPNETELEIITGLPVSSMENILRAARSLIREGILRVIVTLGAKGSLYVDETEDFLAEPFPVRPVDSTGAGDAFIGSFIVHFLRSGKIPESMRFANRYAACSTTREGTQKSFFSRKEFGVILKGGEA